MKILFVSQTRTNIRAFGKSESGALALDVSSLMAARTQLHLIRYFLPPGQN